jgi:hypothetical protein
VVRSNHNKTEERSEKIIPWRRHHLRLTDADVALIFNRATMDKMNPPYPLVVTGEEEEEINPQYQETWHGETLTLDLLENLLKRWIPLPPAPGDGGGGGGGGDSSPRVRHESTSHSASASITPGPLLTPNVLLRGGNLTQLCLAK